MDRLISEKAVIDAIDKWVKNMGVLLALPANAVTPLFDSIHELPSVNPQEPKWISVSERLPKSCGMYIVTRKIYDCPDTAPIIMSDESWFDGQNTWHNDNRINHKRGYLSDVIAWMPLPEPYKAESEDKE